MATYKPKQKIDKNGTLEEVKIPIESVDGLSDKLSEKVSLEEQNALVAHNEQEFNSFIAIENSGKIISYNKKLYRVDVNNLGPNPPKVGDVITELYFNTNITPDLSPETYYPIRIAREDGTDRVLVLSSSSTGLFVYRIFSTGAATAYSNTSGWAFDRFVYEQPLTVSKTEKEDIWSNFISKTPFGDFAIVVEVGSEKANASDVQDEFKKKGVHFISKNDITVTSGASLLAEKWVVDGVDGITEPFDGMIIAVRIRSNADSASNIVLSINGGATYYPFIVSTASRILGLKNVYGASSTVMFVFNATYPVGNVYLESGIPSTIMGCWQVSDRDDTNTVSQQLDNENNEKPILTKTTNSTNDTTSGTDFSANVTINHSTGTLSATAFKENGVSLADKYALKDDAGGNCFENLSHIDLDDQSVDGINISSDGVSFHNYHAFYDNDENALGASTTTIKVPFVAGDGIEFAQEFDGSSIKISNDLPTEEVEAIDLPTVKAKLKPASEIGGGVGTGYELSYVNIEPAENNMFDNVDIANQKVRFNLRVIEMSFGDSDNVVWSGQDVTLDLPIVAGKGITFEPMQELGESALTISLAEAEREEVFDLDGNDYINKGDRVFEILNHAKGVVRGQYIVHNGFGTSPTSYRIMRFQFTNQQDIYHINTHTVERNVTYTENGVEYANANIVVYVVIGGALSINAYAFDITNGRSVTLTKDTTKPHRIVLDYIDYDDDFGQ